MNRKNKKIVATIATTLGIGIGIMGFRSIYLNSIPAYYSVNVLKEVTGAAITTYDDTIDNYPSLANTLLSNDIDIYQNGHMVSQGLTITPSYVLTSCYDSNKDNNSIIVTLDKKTGKLVNICELDNKAHVGGIAYDDCNKLLWVSGDDGNINAYDIYSIVSKYKCTSKYANLNVGKGLRNYKYPWLNSVASMTIYDDKLYVGSFQAINNGLIKQYRIDEDKKKRRIRLSYEREFVIPSQVQGFSFYKKDDKTYMLLSRSFGRSRSSIIQIFNYKDDILDYSNGIPYVYYKAPSMLEQIYSDDDSLYTIYESGAKVYEDGMESVNSLYIFDLPKLIKKL